MIPSAFSCHAHIDFKVVDGPFYGSPYFIEGIPFRCVPLDPREHAEFHVFIGISGPASLCGAARVFTVANPLSLYHVNFGTAPFDTVRPPLFLCDATAFHGKGGIVGTGGIAVFVKANLFEGTFVPRIVRDQCFLEAEIVLEETVNISRIKSSVPEEGIGVEIGVRGEEIREDGFQGSGVADGFILFRGI